MNLLTQRIDNKYDKTIIVKLAKAWPVRRRWQSDPGSLGTSPQALLVLSVFILYFSVVFVLYFLVVFNLYFLCEIITFLCISSALLFYFFCRCSGNIASGASCPFCFHFVFSLWNDYISMHLFCTSFVFLLLVFMKHRPRCFLSLQFPFQIIIFQYVCT